MEGTVEQHSLVELNVQQRSIESHPLPEKAVIKLQRILTQINQLQMAYREMAELVLIGLGVDMDNNDVILSQDATQYTVRPKNA